MARGLVLDLAWVITGLVQLILVGLAALVAFGEAAEGRSDMGDTWVSSMLFATAQAATVASLAVRVLAALAGSAQGDSGGAFGWTFDVVIVAVLHATLYARCGCGDTLAPVWQLSRAALRKTLNWGASANPDAAAAALRAGQDIYERACRATCSLG